MLQVLALFFVAFFDISAIQRWQNESYTKISGNISNLKSPTTQVQHFKDDGRLRFYSYAVFEDKYQKYKNILLNKADIPNWLFDMRYQNQMRGELWHHGIHNGVPCNVFKNDSILFHINTIGNYDLEIFAKVFINTLDFGSKGTILYSNLDRGFEQPGLDKLSDLYIVVWAFSHPTRPGWTVVVMDVDATSPWPIAYGKSEKYLKWQVENLMLNVGDKIK